MPDLAPLVRSEIADTSLRGQIEAMLAQLDYARPSNLRKQSYYDFEARVPRSKVLPAAWQIAKQIVGWPATVVDVLEERLDFYGWRGDESGVLKAFFTDCGLDLEATLAHLDALIFGVSFLAYDPHAVARGDEQLITAESPLNTTGIWSPHRRRLDAAITIVERDPSTGMPKVLSWADIAETGRLRLVSGVWRWEDRQPHRLGRTPVLQLINRPRGSRLGGRSEISLPVRSYTDQAVQTIAGMSANRDFYAYPQRFAENVPDGAFTDEAGNPLPGWVTAMAAMLNAPPPAPNQPPVKFGSFAASPPTPYLEQLRGLATHLSGEAAVPPHYLGILTDNPASAEAIKNIESRLIKRTERRQVTFGWAWRELGRLVLAAHGKDAAGITCHWRAAATPTVAAETDAIVKLIQAGAIPATSSVAYDRMHFTSEEQDRIAADWKRAGPTGVGALAAALSRQTGPTE